MFESPRHLRHPGQSQHSCPFCPFCAWKQRTIGTDVRVISPMQAEWRTLSGVFAWTCPETTQKPDKFSDELSHSQGFNFKLISFDTRQATFSEKTRPLEFHWYFPTSIQKREVLWVVCGNTDWRNLHAHASSALHATHICPKQPLLSSAADTSFDVVRLHLRKDKGVQILWTEMAVLHSD